MNTVPSLNETLASLKAESALLDRARDNQAVPPASVEQLVPRLGDYLIQQGYITPEQLTIALDHQTHTGLLRSGQRLGQRLVALGFINQETLDRALAQQIFELQNALIEANRHLEQRVAERTAELESALVRLAELNQLKANFVSNVSHELRTPLTQVKGYTLLMADGALGHVTGEQHEALQVSVRALTRLEQLINDLIAYATAAKGEMTLNLATLDATVLMHQVATWGQDQSRKKGLLFDAHLPSQPVYVRGDEEKLRWVLIQLVDNAVKFTPTQGHIDIQLDIEGHLASFSVRDTGIGFAPHRLAEIFEPFRQLDGSSTRRHGGTGLGLSLVKRIIEAHGTHMHVTSGENQGSRFAFHLPMLG